MHYGAEKLPWKNYFGQVRRGVKNEREACCSSPDKRQATSIEPVKRFSTSLLTA